MPNYVKLPPFDDDGNLNMVVETPRGSTVKLKYEPKSKVFMVFARAYSGAVLSIRLGIHPRHKSGGR
jgi:inorganic pyrophosphatase